MDKAGKINSVLCYKLYGSLFILLGIVGLCWTGFQFNKTLSFQQSEVKTIGVIVSVEAKLIHGRYSSTDVDIPTISFRDSSGKVFTFISDIHYSPGNISSGQQIAVGYDRNDPNIAHIDEPNNMSLWIFVGFDFILSLLFFFMSWVIFMSLKKKLLPLPQDNISKI